MGKVLIQMASDGDSEEALAAKAVFKWPAPPAKAEEEEGTEAAEATAAPAIEDEPAAKPVFFCKCASLFPWPPCDCSACFHAQADTLSLW